MTNAQTNTSSSSDNLVGLKGWLILLVLFIIYCLGMFFFNSLGNVIAIFDPNFVIDDPGFVAQYFAELSPRFILLAVISIAVVLLFIATLYLFFKCHYWFKSVFYLALLGKMIYGVTEFVVLQLYVFFCEEIGLSEIIIANLLFVSIPFLYVFFSRRVKHTFVKGKKN